MIYWDLLLGFLQVGCFAFGGAYGAIPLIRDIVLRYGWLTEESLTYMIAVSESTPGPIMVNLATYVGSNQAGFWGALLATLAVVLPSFVIILLVMIAMRSVLKNPWVQALLRGMKPSVIGIILATGLQMVVKNALPVQTLDLRGLLITVVLAWLMFLPKKKPTPIQLILTAACMGIVVYGI